MSEPRLLSTEELEQLRPPVGWTKLALEGVAQLFDHIAALEEQLQAARAALTKIWMDDRTPMNDWIDIIHWYQRTAKDALDGITAPLSTDPLTPSDRLELADMLAQFRRIKDSEHLVRLESALRGGR